MSRSGDIAGLIRTVFGKKQPRYFTSAIIVAAGSSSRFGGDMPKQFVNLCGMPVIVRSIKAYQQCHSIHEIVVVCREEDIPLYEEFRDRYDLSKLTQIVVGDSTRQLSVVKGLEAVSDRADFVAIADGARCLTTPEMIHRVCLGAYKYDAATAGTRVSDTVKKVKKGFIIETVPRDDVWLAQTPQVFKLNLYRAAAYNAIEQERVATDDNSLVEAIERHVFMVDCGKENIKITTKEDLVHARAIIRDREEREAR